MGVTLTMRANGRNLIGSDEHVRCEWAHLRDSCLTYVLKGDRGTVHYLPVHLISGGFTITEYPEVGGDA